MGNHGVHEGVGFWSHIWFHARVQQLIENQILESDRFSAWSGQNIQFSDKCIFRLFHLKCQKPSKWSV